MTNKRGGYRRGLGRKADVSGTKRINVSLDPVTVEKARRIGNGNLSLGMRMAVKSFTVGDLIDHVLFMTEEDD